MVGQFIQQSLVVVMFLFAVVMALEKGELLDMSYDMEESIPYYPGQGSWKLTSRHKGPLGVVPWVEYNKFSAPEHGGTHMDAPVHFAKGRLYVHQLPLNQLIAPAVRIDIIEQAKANRDYAMTVKDLQDWEAVHGRIPDGCMVFIYSGWGVYYPDRLAFYGSANNDTYLDDQGNSLLHFPAIGPEAAAWLVTNRTIVGVGVETASLDPGPSTDFMAHQILLGANKFAIELVANVDKLPNTGAKVYALPMKIKNGSGAPTRIVAMLDDKATSGAATPAAVYKIIIGTLLGFGVTLLF